MNNVLDKVFPYSHASNKLFGKGKPRFLFVFSSNNTLRRTIQAGKVERNNISEITVSKSTETRRILPLMKSSLGYNLYYIETKYFYSITNSQQDQQI